MTTPSNHSMSRRALGIATLGAAASIAVAVPAQAHRGSSSSFPDRIELPNNFQPEGITIGPRNQAYFGSRFNGDIARADLRTGEVTIISAGPGTASVGLKIDRRGRLFVAGGPAGTLRVIDSVGGELLKTYQLSEGEAFINDVLIAGDSVWVTDSRRATLFRVDLGRRGALPEATGAIDLTGAWVQAPSGSNSANGLADTPDRSALLVINSADGTLHRVDPDTGVTTVVDLGDTILTNGDGLLRAGKLLYVVQNRLNQVAVVQLNDDGSHGTLVQTLTSDDFDVPTTVAKQGRSLYLPNARFGTPAEPTTPYWVTRIEAA